jgi:hypothetical protein
VEEVLCLRRRSAENGEGEAEERAHGRYR